MIRYTAEHLWVRLEDDGHSAVAGITRHAQDTLGDIVLVDVSLRGRQTENTVIGTVESVSRARRRFRSAGSVSYRISTRSARRIVPDG